MQVEGIYTAEPRFEAKAKALKLKQEMAAAAAEEQRVQKEKQYVQERNYGGGFGSGSAYVAEEKPQKQRIQVSAADSAVDSAASMRRSRRPCRIQIRRLDGSCVES